MNDVQSHNFFGHPAVLILDDEPDHATIVQWLIAEVAPDIPVETMTQADALARRLAAAPDGALLLIDRMLNGRESLELLPELRAARPDLTVVLISAALSETDRARALAAGADRALEKPGQLGGWRALLGQLLRPRGDSWSAAA